MKRLLLVLMITTVIISCTQKKPTTIINEPVVPEIIQEPDNKESEVIDEYKVEIAEDFVGVYLPIKYIENITNNKNHSQTIHSEDANYHNLFIVTKDKIYSDLKWHDGYAIKKTDNDNYKYSVEENQHIIIDNNGYSYKMISKDIKNAYKVIDEYIISIIFNDLKAQRKITILDNKVQIDGKQFEVCLDDMFFPRDNNLILFNREEKLLLGLKIIDKRYVFYRIIPESEGPGNINSDEVVYEIIEE